MQVEEKRTHEQLGRHDPTLATAESRKVIQVDYWRPEDLNAEGKCAEHNHADFLVCHVLLEKNRD